jgi:hypothetical protein
MIALLALLFGSLAPAVKLMWPESVACGMACCLESGVCYCDSGSHSRAGVESHEHSERTQSPDELDASQPAELAATITSSCPAQCAQVPAGFQKNGSSVKPRAPERVLPADASLLNYAHTLHFARIALLDDSSSPRAPPSALL